MSIHPIDHLLITRSIELPDSPPYIIIENKQGNRSVLLEGVLLKAQFKTEHGYLLFITDNCPFEERLQIALLDHDLQIIDKLSLGLVHNIGFLLNLEIISENQMSFIFFMDDETWILEIFDYPSRTKPKNTFPAKRTMPIWHKIWNKPWLRLTTASKD